MTLYEDNLCSVYSCDSSAVTPKAIFVKNKKTLTSPTFFSTLHDHLEYNHKIETCKRL